jgi:XTP/dITP diphosphohydrolase
VLGRGNGTRGELFARVAEITWAGGDPEHELRGSALRFAQQVRSAEAAAREAGLDPHALDETEWRRFWPTSLES